MMIIESHRRAYSVPRALRQTNSRTHSPPFGFIESRRFGTPSFSSEEIFSITSVSKIKRWGVLENPSIITARLHRPTSADCSLLSPSCLRLDQHAASHPSFRLEQDTQVVLNVSRVDRMPAQQCTFVGDSTSRPSHNLNKSYIANPRS